MNMDFESDRRALEDFIDSRMNELGIDELSVEEFMELAFEYFEANPIPDQTIELGRRAITYNRLTGEMDTWFKLPFVQLYWRKGRFFNDIGQCLLAHFPSLGKLAPINPRRWLEYFGLVDSKNYGDYYMYNRR
jgi:hypothetical protein